MARCGLLLLGAALSVAAGGGCLRCHYTAYRECLRPTEQAAVPAPARAKVYVFLMNGLDVFDAGGLKELEHEIVTAGFPKVYYAQRFDEAWYYHEIHRLHREDADFRFVLVGVGAAATQLHELACKVTKDGIPLEAVVFLDPSFSSADPVTDALYPTKVIRSHRWIGAPRLKASEELKVKRVGHLHLPNSPVAMAELVGILTDAACKVPTPRLDFECIPILDEKKPIPRPNEPKQVPPPPPGWGVLCPEFGHPV
jgi:hypothetical protein